MVLRGKFEEQRLTLLLAMTDLDDRFLSRLARMMPLLMVVPYAKISLKNARIAAHDRSSADLL